METTLVMPNDKRELVIVAIGLSGSGISTTVDSLINESESNKSHTGAPCSFRELEITTDHTTIAKSITILDTPGLEISASEEQKAKALAQIESEVQRVCRANVIKSPDIVLAVSRFDDNRIDGHVSRLAKTLRAFDTIADTLFTKDISNVVFVLTHGFNFSLEEDKIATFSSVIKSYSTIGGMPFPIVVVENSKHLTEFNANSNSENDSPNGCQSLLDIWKAIFNIVKLRATDLEDVIQTFAHVSQAGSSIVSTNMVMPSVDVGYNQDNFERILLELSVRESLGSNCFVQSTLTAAWDRMINRPCPDHLERIKYVFHYQKIFTFGDIPKQDSEIATLAKLLPNDSSTVALLKEVFGIQIPSINLLSSHIGSTFNVARHNFELCNIFEFDQSEYHIGPWGYLLPKEINCKPLYNSVHVFKAVPTEGAYKKARNTDIGIHSVSTKEVDGFVHVLYVEPGYNILPYENEAGKKFSWLREFHCYELTLDINLNSIPLHPTFLARVLGLRPYSSDTRKIYKNFFKQFGTHVVKKCFAGGQIQMNGQISKAFSLTRFKDWNMDYWVFFPYWWSTYNWRMAYLEGTLKQLLGGETINNDQNVEIKFQTDKQRSSVFSTSHNYMEEIKKERNSWTQSCGTHPMILNHKIELAMITDYIPLQYGKQKDELSKAYDDIYSNKSQYYCTVM